jgi:long-chain acyl-CoA synthetase
MTAAALLLVSVAAAGAQVSGVKLDDQATVDGTPLVLNGAGLRSEFLFFDVYVAGLYLPAKSADAQAIIGAHEPRRIVMVMKRTVGAKRMAEALQKGIQKNLTESEQQALKPKLDELDRIMNGIGSAKDGDIITLDFGADGGVQLGLNGRPLDRIAGPDIGPALLKVWIGQHPAQDDLKAALLGKK